jgi:hypothetical protein
MAGCGSNATTLLAGLLLTACADDPVECLDESAGRYMPIETGASWTYEVASPDGSVKTKTQSVGALEDVGGMKAGTMAYKLTTTKGTGMTVSWQQDTGTAIIRHREQDRSGTKHFDEYYVPAHTRIDETEAHLVAGATWTESYDELAYPINDPSAVMTTAHKVDTWLVMKEDAQVEVPAGKYCALQLQRKSKVGSVAGSTKYYWFVRGVGKIKEKTDGGDVESLTSVTLP